MGMVTMVEMDRILQGDALEVLRGLPDGCVDAVVTDPPSGIGFMGVGWDRDKGGRDAWIAWLAEVMGECLRVLKPGGHALVWALPRTSHWTGMALEDAGFEIRDCVYHVFGSGFPKSLDVSKAIDKAAGAQREVVGEYKGATNIGKGSSNSYIVGDEHAPRTTVPITNPATPEAQAWQGWGTALKPAVEVWWLVRKPLAEPTVASNVLRYGTGALNIDGCRVATDEVTALAPSLVRATAAPFGAGMAMGGRGHEQGRWPAHLVLDEEAAALLDAQSGVSTSPAHYHRSRPVTNGDGVFGASGYAEREEQLGYGDTGGASRFFYVAKASRSERNAGCEGLPERVVGSLQGGDAGYEDDVSRRFRKAARNVHPTVKPVALMRWLVRLITPPGGLVLDPFAGSGTTLVAAIAEGFHFLGVEREAEYAAIAEARVAHALREHGRAEPPAPVVPAMLPTRRAVVAKRRPAPQASLWDSLEREEAA